MLLSSTWLKHQQPTRNQNLSGANQSQIPTPLGGGKYGYLGAVIPPVDNNALPHAVPFAVPGNPGNFLAVGLAGTLHKIADGMRAHGTTTATY
jgi:hypothetical protein